MPTKTLMHLATAAASFALLAGAAAAAPSGQPSPEGDADLWSVAWWPNNEAEQRLWIDDEGDRIWGLPGDSGWVRFKRVVQNGPHPCGFDDTPESANGPGTGPKTCSGSGSFNAVYDNQVPPVASSRLELDDGTIISETVPNYPYIWKVTAPEEPYSGTVYVTYRDADDEDGDGNLTERFHRKIGTFITKTPRPQPSIASVNDNIDITTVIDVSGSMNGNDPDFKRRDGLDLVFRTSQAGDRVGVNTFNHAATQRLAMTSITGNQQAKNLSASVQGQINNGGGTDYISAFDIGFTQLYQDALAQNSLNSRRKLAVFLTDGKHADRVLQSIDWDNYLNTHIRFTHSPSQYSWPVCAIQLGTSFSSRDVNRLERIADSTGGAYVHATTDAALVDALYECRGVAGCEDTIQRRSWGSVAKNQELATTAVIPTGHERASFLVTGDNLRHTVDLVGPSGNKYNSTNLSAGITVKTGRTWTIFEVENPASGDWELEIKATGAKNSGNDRVIARTTVDNCTPEVTFSPED